MCVRVYLCVCLCEFKFFFKRQLSFEIPLDMYLPERLLLMGEKKDEKLKKKPCYNMGENCQQVLLIGAYFIQCWCVVVLVHICLFNHPFFPLGGWGIKAGGGSCSWERRGKRIEYFVIVQSEGDSMYISILYICDENALAFCVTLPFTCTMVLHSVFQCW